MPAGLDMSGNASGINTLSSVFFTSQQNFLFHNGTEFAEGNLLQNRRDFDSRDPFKVTLDFFNIYLTPIIICVGIAGNFIAIVVLQKTFLRLKPWSLFLAFKAFADIGYLLCLFLIWLPRVNILVFHSPGVCQTASYLNYVFYCLSVWSVVGLNIERYLTLYYPQLTEKYCTRKETTVFILINSLIVLVGYNFAIWTNHVVRLNGVPVCMPKPEYYHLMTVLKVIDKVVVFFIPVAVIVCLNLCILTKLWLYRKLFKDKSKPEQDSTDSIGRLRNSSSIVQATLSQSGRVKFTFYKSSNATNGCLCSVCATGQSDATGKRPREGWQQQHHHHKAPRSISRFRSSRLLVSVCALFLLTVSPAQLFQFRTLLNTRESFRESKLYLNLQELCHILSFANFSMLFVVLIFSNDSFRTALFRLMVRCKQGKKNAKALDISG